jgi:hypothetical protein
MHPSTTQFAGESGTYGIAPRPVLDLLRVGGAGHDAVELLPALELRESRVALPVVLDH